MTRKINKTYKGLFNTYIIGCKEC